MPVYAYKGVTSTGRSTRGTVTADNARAARARMRGDGIILTELAESGQGEAAGEEAEGFQRFNVDLSRLRRVPPAELSMATRQLATLVAAGVPLVEALGALVQQIEHRRLKGLFASVRDRVNEGASLADALDATAQFDTLYCSMIRAGEASGALELVLARIADYLEDSVRLTNKVGSILVYPLFMLLFTGVVVATLVTVVLPQITGLLHSLDATLPWYTVVIIEASNWARQWWWAALAGAIAFGLVFRWAVNTETGRPIYDRARLQMPILGRVNRVVAIARFTRTLATLLAGGVGIVHAMDIARNVANNTIIAGVIDEARANILEGASLSAPLRQSGEIPALVTTMIEVGERSGELDAMLGKVAETYDEQVETTVTRLTALLEPLLILVMVGIVLFIILATLMPLMEITQQMA